MRFARSFVRSFLVMVAVVVAAMTMLPSTAVAQGGWRDRLKKAAMDKMGVTEPLYALQLMRAYQKARETVVPVAGTYKITLTVSGTDSLVLYGRTFNKKDQPYAMMDSTDETRMDLTRGYVMVLAMASTPDSLPASLADVDAMATRLSAMPDAERAKHMPSAGMLIFIQDHPNDQMLGAYSAYPMIELATTSPTDHAIYQRYMSVVSHEMTPADVRAQQQQAASEGKQSVKPLPRLDGTAAFTLPTADAPIVFTMVRSNAGVTATARVERISTAAIQR